jgi:flagellar protein FlaJ
MTYNAKYPKIILAKKARNLEKNMVYALKHILVQVKSGVPLFNSIVTVSEKNYGEMSLLMKKLVKEVETGTPLEAAMDEMALESSSENFRRALWQISNSLKSGVEISETLRNIISNMTHEQRIAIRRYGSQLNPLTLVYMMVAVILPALGITLMIVMSSFSGTAVPQSIFYLLLFAVGAFQFIFIGMIKSKRPSV